MGAIAKVDPNIICSKSFSPLLIEYYFITYPIIAWFAYVNVHLWFLQLFSKSSLLKFSETLIYLFLSNGALYFMQLFAVGIINDFKLTFKNK